MSNGVMKSGSILLYQNDMEKEIVNVVFYDENFWMTQSGMAELFDCTSKGRFSHEAAVKKVSEVYSEFRKKQDAD